MPRLRFLRAILGGFLAEVLTIVTVLVVVYGRQLAAALPPQELQSFMQRAGAIVGPTFGVVYTFVMALWVLRRVEGRYVAHALIVAASAVVFHTLGTLGAPGGYQPTYAVADVCKLAAGVAAGLIAGRRQAAPIASSLQQ